MKSVSYVKSAPRTLSVLDYGLFKVHSNGRIIGICGFLIRTTADETILIDTGFPRKYAYDITTSSAEDRLGEFGEVLELGERNLPDAQLALSGVAAADIDLLIMTHTHIDHVGGIADFPGTPILMSRAERALDRPLYWGAVRPIDWPDREYRLIDEDTEIGPGLRVLHVPGHAPGQLAIEVDLPETGTVLITGDAISRPSEIDEGFAGSWDAEQAAANAGRLMRRAEARDAFVIYGHAPEQWPTLRKAPEVYS
ncbi:N-acyl homoserine lactonase family protein [Roseivivax isoporae]|uniref:Metallo-beta-lactamase n=1 Tax=Roseivivax isoporae LMG 25204 TaxID=1449351 RepID=X7F7Q0_9RHOB|nr:N-acyl homoserine lactonase family protein [Roseivivax isoporae]ETX28101.1 metallo-beta-lactamase [Roseivivax isoporae LMG 25204]